MTMMTEVIVVVEVVVVEVIVVEVVVVAAVGYSMIVASCIVVEEVIGCFEMLKVMALVAVRMTLVHFVVSIYFMIY